VPQASRYTSRGANERVVGERQIIETVDQTSIPVSDDSRSVSPGDAFDAFRDASFGICVGQFAEGDLAFCPNHRVNPGKSLEGQLVDKRYVMSTEHDLQSRSHFPEQFRNPDHCRERGALNGKSDKVRFLPNNHARRILIDGLLHRKLVAANGKNQIEDRDIMTRMPENRSEIDQPQRWQVVE